MAKIVMSGSDTAWEKLIDSLWAATGDEFTVDLNEATRHGHEAEKIGLGLLWEGMVDAVFETPMFLPAVPSALPEQIRPYANMLGVSPDAIGHDAAGDFIVEIKSPYTEARWNFYRETVGCGVVPDEHVDQVQHAMYVTGIPRAVLVAHNTIEYVTVVVTPIESWRERYTRRLHAFMRQYLEGVKATRDPIGIDLIERL